MLVALLVASVATACPATGAVIVISTSEHELHLCATGAIVASYPVALGRRGNGKSREGDLKTPLGSFALGALQPSRRFHLFIPIGYPNAAQRAGGATGGSVGLHGPDRRLAWAGRANTSIDWTRGCIAVGNDGEIDAIAAWIGRTHARQILIE